MMKVDCHGLVDGTTPEEEMLFKEIRMKMLREETLPALKKILDDNDERGFMVLVYENKYGETKQAYPRWVLKMLYAQVHKLLDYLEE